MQLEIREKQRALRDGEAACPGWARHPVWIYDRRDIKKGRGVLERDSYIIEAEGITIILGMSTAGSLQEAELCLMDRGCGILKSGSTGDLLSGFRQHSRRIAVPFSAAGLEFRALPFSGVSEFSARGLRIRAAAEPGRRRLRCRFRDFWENQAMEADIRISSRQKESLWFLMPGKKGRKHFSLTGVLSCMKASGIIKLGEMETSFKGSAALVTERSSGFMSDRGFRGVCSNEDFGFNIGGGSGDRSVAGENTLMTGGRLHKLENVYVQSGRDEKGRLDHMQPWTITSSDGRLEAVFIPELQSIVPGFHGLLGEHRYISGIVTGTAVDDEGSEYKMKELQAVFML